MTDEGTEPSQSPQANKTPATLPEQPKEAGLFGKTVVGISDAFMRELLAGAFFVLFLLTVVLSFFHLSTSDWPQTKDWLQLLLPAETALLGSATGFYFGTRKAEGTDTPSK